MAMNYGLELVTIYCTRNNMENWFYIPYKLGQWGSTKIYEDSGMTFIGNPYNEYWMSNGPYCQYGVQGQRSMYYSAHGKVLCCLGMGLLPLMMALKPEVTEVVAIEIDKDIIDAFNAQGFDTSKLTIRHQDMMFVDDLETYDCIFMDAAPVQYEFFEKNKDKFKGKSVILQGWESEYIAWLGNYKFGIPSLENYLEYAEIFCMPKFSEEELNDYLFTYYAKVQKADREARGKLQKWSVTMEQANAPIDSNLVSALIEIHNRRH